TPTHASWLNAVEGWVSKLTTKRLRRGSFANVPQLTRAIREYVVAHNAVSMPFTWTKDTDEILRKVHKISRLAVTAHQYQHVQGQLDGSSESSAGGPTEPKNFRRTFRVKPQRT